MAAALCGCCVAAAWLLRCVAAAWLLRCVAAALCGCWYEGNVCAGVATNGCQYSVQGASGRRADAFNTFVEPMLREFDNLEVVSEAFVRRIMFNDQKRATGECNQMVVCVLAGCGGVSLCCLWRC